MRKVVAAVFILSFFASQGDCRVGGVYFCKTTWLNFSVKHCVLFSNNYLVSPSHFFFFFVGEGSVHFLSGYGIWETNLSFISLQCDQRPDGKLEPSTDFTKFG